MTSCEDQLHQVLVFIRDRVNQVLREDGASTYIPQENPKSLVCTRIIDGKSATLHLDMHDLTCGSHVQIREYMVPDFFASYIIPQIHAFYFSARTHDAAQNLSSEVSTALGKKVIMSRKHFPNAAPAPVGGGCAAARRRRGV
jgi:hypothetical protein